MHQPWLNLETYSPLMLTLFISGCVLWVVVYVIVIYNIRVNQFVEIPLIGVSANICWEFIWSFVYQPDMGKLVLIGYAAWFFLDCFIFYALLRYGWKQLNTPALRNNSKKLILFMTVSWAALFIGLAQSHYDTPIGTISAYWDNLVFSGAYCWMILNATSPKYYSSAAGWCKGLGTGLIGVAVLIQWPDNSFLWAIVITTALLDAFYLVQLRRIHAGHATQPQGS